MSHVVKWVAPTKRSDNSPLSAGEIARYEVQIDGINAMATTSLSADLSTSSLYKGLPPGPHSVHVVAISKYGTSSAPSSAVSITIAPPAVPAAPTDVTVT